VGQSQRSSGVLPAADQPGTLTVIDLRQAEIDPASSVVATADAGCQPVRVIASADGSQVWVTARASDDLPCFSSARLVSDPAHALVAIVRVGEAPVGLAAVRDGSLIIVADSDRFGASGASADLDVVNVPAPAARRHAAGVELHLRPARSNRRGEHPRWLKPLPQAGEPLPHSVFGRCRRPLLE
jgi:DNA-binding beta-propeller fold protein YncE